MRKNNISIFYSTCENDASLWLNNAQVREIDVLVDRDMSKTVTPPWQQPLPWFLVLLLLCNIQGELL